MRNFFILVFVAIITIGIILWIKRPDIIEGIWLWLVGLAGTIGGFFQTIAAWFKTKFGSSDKDAGMDEKVKAAIAKETGADPATLDRIENRVTKGDAAAGATPAAGADTPAAAANFAAKEAQYKSTIAGLEAQIAEAQATLQAEQKAREAEKMVHPASTFNGTTITVLRYWNDDDTTLGLLFIDYKYFSYTLEDAYHEVKVPGQTRIPAGTYNLDFNKADTNLTQRYRKARWIKDIFDYHLEIKNVPNYGGVYVHNGGTSKDTEGCLLVSDQLSVGDNRQALTNSRKTFRAFYQRIGDLLRSKKSVRIIIKDEDWFQNNVRQPKAA